MLTGAKFFYWNANELTTLINKCLENSSKDGLEAKIKSISDENFFSQIKVFFFLFMPF